MSTFGFLLGSAPELAVAEIKSVLGLTELETVWGPSNIAYAAVESPITAETLQNVLGGTVKIFEVLAKVTDSEPSAIERQIAEYLQQLPDEKLEFCVGELNRDQVAPLAPEMIKRQLVAANRRCRYMETPRTGSSTALWSHQQPLEILVVFHQQQWWLARTLTCSDPDEWTRRDRGKPYAEHKKGLLPPKVGRMMLNVALGPIETRDPKSGVVYDPFCGSGTILMEARTLGYATYGSDLDSAAVAGTEQNCSWQETFEPNLPAVMLRTTEVTQAPTALQPIHWLVTEPFLGRQTPQVDQISGVLRGLEKLYWGAFRHWTSLLAPGAQVVIVLPRLGTSVHQAAPDHSWQHLIDKVAGIGYTMQSGPHEYARPDAVVKRGVYHFEFHQTK